MRDFSQRYSKTYCYFGDQLVFINRINVDSVEFSSLAGSKFVAMRDSGVGWKFTQISRGWYNGKDGAYLLSRMPYRQWKRGISTENTLMQRLYGDSLEAAQMDFVSLADCLKDIKAKEGALSREFAVSPTKVFLYDQLIGVRQDTQLILDNDLFVQELSDVIRRNNLSYTVHVND